MDGNKFSVRDYAKRLLVMALGALATQLIYCWYTNKEFQLFYYAISIMGMFFLSNILLIFTKKELY